MQVLGIVGSMRKNRHTDALVRQALQDVHCLDPTVAVEVVYIADRTIHPCRVLCFKHCSKRPFQCTIVDDLADLLQQMANADALVIGAPLYFRAPPAHFQAWAERLVAMAFFRESSGGPPEDSPLFGQPCGLVGVAQYSNPQVVLEYLHDLCTVLKMRPVLLDAFPYLGVAARGDAPEGPPFDSSLRSADLARALLKEVHRANIPSGHSTKQR